MNYPASIPRYHLFTSYMPIVNRTTHGDSRALTRRSGSPGFAGLPSRCERSPGYRRAPIVEVKPARLPPGSLRRPGKWLRPPSSARLPPGDLRRPCPSGLRPPGCRRATSGLRAALRSAGQPARLRPCDHCPASLRLHARPPPSARRQPFGLYICNSGVYICDI